MSEKPETWEEANAEAKRLRLSGVDLREWLFLRGRLSGRREGIEKCIQEIDTGDPEDETGSRTGLYDTDDILGWLHSLLCGKQDSGDREHKHELSKDCWCKPEVINFGENED